MIDKINIKDFSMIDFLNWLDENKDSVSHFNLKQYESLGICNVSMKDDRFEVLQECGVMGVKESHEKICEAFNIDKSRKIADIKVHVCYDDVPRITITELKTD